MPVKFLSVVSVHPTRPVSGTYHLYILSADSKYYFQTDSAEYDLAELGSPHTSIPIRNETGATLTKGTLVYVNGWNATFEIVTVDKADKDDPDKRPTIGFVEADLDHNTNGEALSAGLLSGCDTSSYSVTDQLVLGNNGACSRPPPDQSPFTGEIQNVGSVTRSHATEGSIVVSIDGLNAVTGAQIFALAGTNGTPGPSNKYVTDSDPRNTNARIPTAHASTHSDGGSDEISVENLATSESDTGKRLAPNGSGGLVFVNRNVYGENYQRSEQLSETSTTAGSPETRVQLVTPALTGTFEVHFHCMRANANKLGYTRFYNATDADILGAVKPVRTAALTENYPDFQGTYQVSFTGASKTFQLQYWDYQGTNDQYIKDAYIIFKRVA